MIQLHTIEAPEALLRIPTVSLSGDEEWVLYEDEAMVLLSASSDPIGAAVTTDGSAFHLPGPAHWRVLLTASYTSLVTEGGVQFNPIALSRSGLDIPTQQALFEGALYRNTDGTAQCPIAFERIIHADAAGEDVGLFAWVNGNFDLQDVMIEVEYIGQASYPLPGIWNVNASDVVVNANVQLAGAPSGDSEKIDTWIRREGAANWAQATSAQQGDYDRDGYDNDATNTESLAGIRIQLGDPNWYQLDSQAAAFNGDPSFVYFESFDAAAASTGAINVLLSIANASGGRCVIRESSGQLQVERVGSGGTSSRTGGTLSEERNWIVVSRNAAAGTVTIWVNSTTPVVDNLSLGGGNFNPTTLTLGAYRDSIPTVNEASTRVIRRSHLAVNRTLKQTQVNEIAAFLERWGEF